MSGAILDGVPRVRLGHFPTPLERMDRLSEALNGPEIWIKRDDCTGLATGGNKTRKLEFIVADAQQQGCDTLVTLGKIQSNHARQTAAAASKAGMSCVLLLEQLAANQSATYRGNGNALLDQILGAEVVVVAPGERTAAFTESRLAELSASGRTPYLVPVGGSDAVGSTGYVSCALELNDQLTSLDIDANHLVMATGSGGTQAGLVIGFHAAGRETTVVGFSVSDNAADQRDKVIGIVDNCSTHLGLATAPNDLVCVDDNTLGPGYGQPDSRTVEAIELFAQTEGIVLDPVYTGKAAAGLIAGCREGRFNAGERVVFLHTGGQAGTFAYEDVLSQMLE